MLQRLASERKCTFDGLADQSSRRLEIVEELAAQAAAIADPLLQRLLLVESCRLLEHSFDQLRPPAPPTAID